MKGETIFKTVVGVICFVLLSLMLAGSLFAQNIGMNGNGFFENRTEQSDEWLHELFGDEVFTLRFPGGAATKYADPLSGGGWGINYTIVDSITIKYGSAEEEAQEGVLEKWYQKSDAQPAYSYLDEIIDLQDEFPNMRVIWVANYLIPAERGFYPIEYLLEHDVNLVLVEIGNESYSQVKYDFDGYWAMTRDLVGMVKALLIPVAYPAPAGGIRDSRTHSAWNEALNDHLTGEGVIFHPYYDRREFPSLAGTDTALMFDQIGAWDFNQQFQEEKAQFPNAGFFSVTESNSQPSNLIGDTELNRYLVYRLLTAGKEEFTDFLIHSGVSPDKYGIIYGTDRSGGQKRNTSYYAFSDVLSNVNPSPCDTTVTPAIYDTTYQQITIQPNNPRCERFWYRLFNGKACKPVTIIQTVVTLVSQADTVINCDTIPTGCVNPFGTDPERRECKTGLNDDFLHMERFVDENGDCYCDEPGVIFDHRINTKFNDVIIPDIFNQTGVWINTDLVDFHITNPLTGEVAVFEDIFNWCKEGKPYPFNTNAELWALWEESLTGHNKVIFPVEMIDRETGLIISLLWEDHTDMELNMNGL